MDQVLPLSRYELPTVDDLHSIRLSEFLSVQYFAYLVLYS